MLTGSVQNAGNTGQNVQRLRAAQGGHAGQNHAAAGQGIAQGGQRRGREIEMAGIVAAGGPAQQPKEHRQGQGQQKKDGPGRVLSRIQAPLVRALCPQPQQQQYAQSARQQGHEIGITQ